MQRLAVQVRLFLRDGLVVVGDIGRVMLAVMDLHRLLVDVGLKCVGCEGQGFVLEGHEISFKFCDLSDSFPDRSVCARGERVNGNSGHNATADARIRAEAFD